MKTENELRQLFKNNSDCYADTWTQNGGTMEEGDVIQAMTEDRFIELLKELKLIPIQIILPITTPSKQMDDYEFNLHQHWKDEPKSDDDDYGGTIKHFQD